VKNLEQTGGQENEENYLFDVSYFACFVLC